MFSSKPSKLFQKEGSLRGTISNRIAEIDKVLFPHMKERKKNKKQGQKHTWEWSTQPTPTSLQIKRSVPKVTLTTPDGTTMNIERAPAWTNATQSDESWGLRMTWTYSPGLSPVWKPRRDIMAAIEVLQANMAEVKEKVEDLRRKIQRAERQVLNRQQGIQSDRTNRDLYEAKYSARIWKRSVDRLKPALDRYEDELERTTETLESVQITMAEREERDGIHSETPEPSETTASSQVTVKTYETSIKGPVPSEKTASQPENV